MSSQDDACWPDLLGMLVARYGDGSNAALMARWEWLLALLSDEAATRKDWAPLVERIVNHYTLTRPVQSAVSDFVSLTQDDTGCKIYHFSRAVYEQRYGRADPTKASIVRNRADADRLADRSWRLFVVSDRDELLVHPHAMNVVDMIVNRNGGEGHVPLVHPMLVADRRLAVKAAGEMAVVQTSKGGLAAAFTTKSGHFCPAPQTAEVAATVIGERIASDRVAAVPVRLRVPATRADQP